LLCDVAAVLARRPYQILIVHDYVCLARLDVFLPFGPFDRYVLDHHPASARFATILVPLLPQNSNKEQHHNDEKARDDSSRKDVHAKFSLDDVYIITDCVLGVI
jgi:hypothetical protein